MESVERFAVIDIETNWDNALMSIGIVIANGETMCPIDARYFIIAPEYERGGMYFNRLDLFKPAEILLRCELEREMRTYLKVHGVKRIFAYNAKFDRGLLPEMSNFVWHDIIRLAAYRQYNAKISAAIPCYKTGRMKSNYGVEPMLRMLSGAKNYFETHNAMIDALDELSIMRLLEHPLSAYECAVI